MVGNFSTEVNIRSPFQWVTDGSREGHKGEVVVANGKCEYIVGFEGVLWFVQQRDVELELL